MRAWPAHALLGVLWLLHWLPLSWQAVLGAGLGRALYTLARERRRIAARNVMRFFAHESCGQCTPCREGTGWLWRMVDRIEHGQGRASDLDMLNSVSDNIQGRTICALGDAAAMPVRGMIKHFRHEFEYHVEHKTCMVPAYV